jgi:hypothetical protein
MNDDVLACIGQFADADARRAMGFPPNRLSPSSDSQYARLCKLLAQRRIRSLSEDWYTVLVKDERLYHRVTIDRHEGGIYVVHQYRQPDSGHCWKFSYGDQIEYCRYGWCDTLQQRFIWQGGQWVAAQ